MDILITYDVKTPYVGDSKNNEVKDGMIELGYASDFNDGKNNYYLPNTSLWKANITAETAKKDLLNVATKCNAKIERLFATVISGWSAIEGEGYK